MLHITHHHNHHHHKKNNNNNTENIFTDKLQFWVKSLKSTLFQNDSQNHKKQLLET